MTRGGNEKWNSWLINHLMYVGVIWFLFHVLHLLPIKLHNKFGLHWQIYNVTFAKTNLIIGHYPLLPWYSSIKLQNLDHLQCLLTLNIFYHNFFDQWANCLCWLIWKISNAWKRKTQIPLKSGIIQRCQRSMRQRTSLKNIYLWVTYWA
jgi:hypothetical protein